MPIADDEKFLSLEKSLIFFVKNINPCLFHDNLIGFFGIDCIGLIISVKLLIEKHIKIRSLLS